MISEKEKIDLLIKMERYEGRVPHLYLDTKGFVTVGVGCLIKDLATAQSLNFKKRNNIPATKEEIKNDYDMVLKQPKNRPAGFYRQHVSLFISDYDINRLASKRIDSFSYELKVIFPEFSKYPFEVRVALFGIIYNVGMTSLNNKWPKLKAAVKAEDWLVAANESSRDWPISKERNDYVRNLFEQAAAHSSKMGGDLGSSVL